MDSYNSEDKAKAEWIAFTLREAGFKVRFAPWELSAGGNIAAWMDEAMADSDRAILVASPDYFDRKKAPYSRMEREGFLWVSPRFFSGTIIPIIVRAAEIPKLYAPFLQIDLTGVGEAEAKTRLIGALSVPAPPVAPPSFEPEPAAPAFEPSPGTGETAATAMNRGYSGLPGLMMLSALAYIIWADQRANGRVLGGLWQVLTGAWPPVLLLMLYGLASWALNAGLDAPEGRRTIAAALRLDRGGELYRSVMRRALGPVENQDSHFVRTVIQAPKGV